LSTKKQEINELTEKAKAQPAVRQEKVDAMKEAIQNQTYNVKGEMVAKSILKSQLLDELL
jgi:flagellar biosynthesis anti-sigma factor FlgM